MIKVFSRDRAGKKINASFETKYFNRGAAKAQRKSNEKIYEKQKDPAFSSPARANLKT
jgi:hypothetical protein